MARRDVKRLKFAAIYPALVKKAERKGRTRDEVDQLIRWLTGYSDAQLARAAEGHDDLEAFFGAAPQMNPRRESITGVICGVRVEEIADPTEKAVRQLDKLVDELARGKTMEKILGR